MDRHELNISYASINDLKFIASVMDIEVCDRRSRESHIIAIRRAVNPVKDECGVNMIGLVIRSGTYEFTSTSTAVMANQRNMTAFTI